MLPFNMSDNEILVYMTCDDSRRLVRAWYHMIWHWMSLSLIYPRRHILIGVVSRLALDARGLAMHALASAVVVRVTAGYIFGVVIFSITSYVRDY